MLSSRTVHGRNLLHFAVAADQPVIFFELLVASPDPDFASCEDNFGKSAADLASDPNLANCERALRQFAYAKRTGALRELAGSRASTVAQQTDVTKTTSVKKPRAASAQVRLATREKSFASLAESELTSKSSYRYSDRRTVSSGYHKVANGLGVGLYLAANQIGKNIVGISGSFNSPGKGFSGGHESF